MKLEPITHHDIDELVRIDKECFDKTQTYDSSFFDKLLSGHQVSRKAIDNAEIIGFVISLFSEKLAVIYTLDVRPRYRRQGVANKLTEVIEDLLKRQGCNEIILQTRVNNSEAINLFVKRGYRQTRRISDYYSKGVDAFEMRKTL